MNTATKEKSFTVSQDKAGRYIYRNSEDKRVPAVTTVIRLLTNAEILKLWANKIGLQGINVKDYVDELASIGSLVHFIIQCHLEEVVPNLDKYTEEQKKQAKNCFHKFYQWFEGQDFELIKSEFSLVCDTFGGTLDIYCKLNGKYTVIDLKTSKTCYPEAFTEVAAFKLLLEEHGYPVDECRILRVGRTQEEGFEDILINNISVHQERFLTCLKLYQINKLI